MTCIANKEQQQWKNDESEQTDFSTPAKLETKSNAAE